MKRILNFIEFITEASFTIPDPNKAGQEFAKILSSTKDVREQPRGSNRGSEVDQYVRSVGLDPSGKYPWCQSYVWWALDQLSKKLGIKNPAPQTASVRGSWDQSPTENKITIAQARANPELVRPGMVFIMQRGTPWSSGGYLGHTGIILTVDPNKKTFQSIEGNTDEKSSGEGDKVGINNRDLSSSSLVGFIDWFKGARTPEFESSFGGPVPPTPTSPAQPQGVITGEIKTSPIKTAPGDDTVGDPEAEERATKLDQEEDTSIVASLLKPMWTPGQKGQGGQTVISRGDVLKAVGKQTHTEELQRKRKEAEAKTATQNTGG